MARVPLPCEEDDWWEDKRLFLLLSHLRTIKDFDLLISSHTRKEEAQTVFYNRLTALRGLREYLANYCTPEEQKTFLTSTLPCIAKAASFLDERVPDTGIPFLYKQESAALVLGRKLVLSLLANAFLCTFPTSSPQSHIAPFNFSTFFAVFLQKDEARMATQSAKLKCILCYFERVAEDKCNLSSVITLRRQSIPKGEVFSMEDWLANSFPLCPVSVKESCTIEDCDTLTLQVDFANKKIGGGVLAGGRVQEEIRFCICPELLVSRLIMDHMDPNEAIIVTGVERFANYSGYGCTLKFDGNYVDEAHRDVFGNILTSIVAIDAKSMSNDQEKQYTLDLFLRELTKAYVGFQCQQDRGDTSTELLALNVKRASSAFVEEFSDYGQPVIPPVSQQSALGNISLSQSLVGSEGSTPLSPIKEMAESPLATSAELAYDYGEFAQKFTESLLGDIGMKKRSAAPPEDAPPTKSSPMGRNLDNQASALSSSILEAAIQPPAGVTSEPQAQLHTSTRVTSARESTDSVDDLASALTSSILSTSLQPSDLRPEKSVDNQPSSVTELVGSLSSSIIQSSLGASSEEKETKLSLFSSEVEPNKISALDCVIDAEAKSIIADVLTLSSSTPPTHGSTSVPKVSQMFGQLSNSTACPPGEDADAVTSLADHLTNSMISEVLSHPPASDVVLASSLSSAASPPLNRPAIFIQVERRGSGGVGDSPRSSRSSSLTGQSLTLHEYTDELVESSCREGLTIAVFQAQGQEGMVEEPPVGEKATSSSLDSFFDSFVSTSIQGALRQTSIEISRADDDEDQPESDVQPSLVSTPQVLKQSPILTRHGLTLASGRRHPTSLSGNLGGDAAGPSDDAPSFQNKLLLSTPSSSSRVSYAWSTASTRDEDSRPVSPTNLDRIALDLTQNVEEFSNLLSKIIVSEVISTLTGMLGPQTKSKDADESEEDEREMDVNNLPTTTKIDVFLSRLDQASPIPEADEGGDGGVSFEATNRGEGVTGSEVADAPYPSMWHKMRSTLLRPVATGNWGCGAFKGDPQLKSMLQWAATSAAGRPMMIYCTFGNAAVKQLAEVTNHIHGKRWTVGQLAAAILNYCKKTQEERKADNVFTYLLKL